MQSFIFNFIECPSWPQTPSTAGSKAKFENIRIFHCLGISVFFKFLNDKIETGEIEKEIKGNMQGNNFSEENKFSRENLSDFDIFAIEQKIDSSKK